MSRYVKKSLADDEEIIAKAKKSWWYITWPTVLFVGAIVGLVFAIPQITNMAQTVKSGVAFVDACLPAIFNHVLPIVLSAVLGLCAFIPFYRHLVTFLTLQLVLTNKRLISKVGLFRIRALDIPVDKIDHIEVRSTLLGNLLHSYEVEIASVSGADGVIAQKRKNVRTFCGISNAKALRSAILEVIDTYAQNERRQQAREIASAMRTN